MTPTPVAVALMICDQVIFEERTHKVSPINIFRGMAVERFPHLPPPFSVFAIVTDGQGNGRIELKVTRLDTDDEILRLGHQVRFPNRRTEVDCHFRFNRCIFPAAGWYEFTMLADGELVAQRRLRVYLKENHS